MGHLWTPTLPSVDQTLASLLGLSGDPSGARYLEGTRAWKLAQDPQQAR